MHENLAKIASQIPDMFRGMTVQIGAMAGQSTQTTFRFLLRPDLAAMLPPPVRETIVGALRLAFPQSIHTVFLIGCDIMVFGAVLTLLMGAA